MRKTLFLISVFVISLSLSFSAQAYDYSCLDFPITITESGTHNLRVGPTCNTNPNNGLIQDVDNTAFIVVEADFVTIDCNNRPVKTTSSYDDETRSTVFIYNKGYDNLEIKNCNLEGFGRAIYYPQQADYTMSGSIHNNIFKENVRAIRLETTNDVDIYNNRFEDNYRGVVVWPKEIGSLPTPHTIRNNVFKTTKHENDAVDLTYCKQWCTADHGYSVWIDQSNEVVLKDNIIEDTYTGSNRIQVLIQNSGNTKLENNTITTRSSIKKSIRLNNAPSTGITDTIYDFLYISTGDLRSSYTVTWNTVFRILTAGVPIKNAEANLKCCISTSPTNMWALPKKSNSDGLIDGGELTAVEGNIEMTSNYNPYRINVTTPMSAYGHYETTFNLPENIEDGIVEINLEAGTGDDDDAPTVALKSPANNEKAGTDAVDFVCEASDDNGLSMVALLWNGTVADVEYLSGDTKTETVNFSETNLDPGTYVWSCKAFDTLYQNTLASNNFTLNVGILTDVDVDGFFAEIDDCNDTNSKINPDEAEKCNGIDDDCDGIVDSFSKECGPATDEGACEFGTKTCTNDVWGDCENAVYSGEEICDDLDNNCDGEVDEGSICCSPIGITALCGVDSLKDGVGICHSGTKRCTENGWTECTGSVGPMLEVPNNGLDDDCDGQTDEGSAVVSCFDGIKNGNEESVDCGGSCLKGCGAGFFEIDLMLVAVVVVIIIIAVLVYFVLRSKKDEEEVSWSDLKDRWS